MPLSESSCCFFCFISTNLLEKHLLQNASLGLPCWIRFFLSAFFLPFFASLSLTTLHFNDWINPLPFPLKGEILQVSPCLQFSHLQVKHLAEESLASSRWSVYIYWLNQTTVIPDKKYRMCQNHRLLFWGSSQQLEKASWFANKVLFIIMLPRLILYVCLHPSYCASDKMVTCRLDFTYFAFHSREWY